MTTEQQIKALAELDNISSGHWQLYAHTSGDTTLQGRLWVDYGQNRNGITLIEMPQYLTSYDSIIPLIQKQPYEVLKRMDEHYELVSFAYEIPSVAQLCEALLRATGKWIE